MLANAIINEIVQVDGRVYEWNVYSNRVVFGIFHMQFDIFYAWGVYSHRAYTAKILPESYAIKNAKGLPRHAPYLLLHCTNLCLIPI